jgi:uncharacterized repeat protein (TIGR01451 family)
MARRARFHQAREPQPTRFHQAREPQPTRFDEAREPQPTRFHQAREPQPTRFDEARESRLARLVERTSVALVVASIATWSLESRAQVAERFSVDQRGDFALIGNTLAQDCALLEEPLSGALGACGANADDSGSDVLWSLAEDGGEPVASTAVDPAEAASIAVLELPSAASVTRAQLFWSAQSGSGDPTVATFGRGADALSVTADQTSTATTDESDFYQSSADVTDLVRELGPGPYRLGGIDVVDPVGLSSAALYAGWWLVVFYELDSDPVRHLGLFDGFGVVDVDQPRSATLAGFEVPLTGGDGKLGVVGFDGDATAGGDQLRLGPTAPLSAAAALGGSDDFFDGSRRSVSGAPLGSAGDQPRFSGGSGSLSGIDLHVVDVGTELEAGQTSVALLATTASDRFFLSGLVLSVATTSPDLSLSTQTVRDVDGPPLRPGDELEYTVTVQNTGSGAAPSVTMSSPLPAQVRYVPGSLELGSGESALALTDEVDADVGELDRGAGETLIVRLGAGASSERGGRLDAGASAVVSYRVVLAPDASGEIVSQALIGVERQTSTQAAGVTLTDSDLAASGVTATSIRVDDCAVDTDCAGGRCDASTTPPRCVECLADGDCAGVRPTCDAAGACVCAANESATELRCDGRDDDCDGTIDEDLAGVPCEVGEGECRGPGLTVCALDGGVVCERNPEAPLPESCGEPSSDCAPGAQSCSAASGNGDGIIAPMGEIPASADPGGGALGAADEPSAGGVAQPIVGDPAPPLRDPAPPRGSAASLGGGGSCNVAPRVSTFDAAPWIALAVGLSRRGWRQRRRTSGRCAREI